MGKLHVMWIVSQKILFILGESIQKLLYSYNFSIDLKSFQNKTVKNIWEKMSLEISTSPFCVHNAIEWECFSPMQPKEITWSPSRVFPPVRACMFSSHLTSVTFLADPSAGGRSAQGHIYLRHLTTARSGEKSQDPLSSASVLQIWEKEEVQGPMLSPDCLPTPGVSSGPVFLLGNWNCFLWRYRWWYWTNSFLWLCYRSREKRWGMD